MPNWEICAMLLTIPFARPPEAIVSSREFCQVDRQIVFAL